MDSYILHSTECAEMDDKGSVYLIPISPQKMLRMQRKRNTNLVM